MPFTDRFQLLGLKRDEGARSFEAREIATGRPVLVHLFADLSPLNCALLAKFDTLPPEERRRIIDRGRHERGVYIVTDRLAEYAGLHEWLRAKHADRAKPLDLGGAWQIRPAAKPSVDDQLATLFETAPTPVVEPSPLEAPKAPVLTNTAEQTLLMRTPPPPEPPVLRPAAPPALPKVPPPPVAPTPPANEASAFTKEFAPPVPLPAAPPPVERAAPAVPPAPAPEEPGEFTKQFPAPVLRPAAPPAPGPQEPGEFTRLFAAAPVKPQAPQKPAPGEFTKQFQAPERSAPVPAPRPAATSPSQSGERQAPGQQPGEFTQMLQAQRPAAPPPAGNVSSNVSSGEFTRFFQSPMTPAGPGAAQHIAPLTPPPPAPKGVGEFTQIFGRDAMPSAPPPPAPAAPPQSSPGNATQVFNVQRPTPPPAFPATPAPNIAPQAPGEYTRMFARPAPLTFGQAPSGPQTPRAPESAPMARNNSRWPMLLLIGAAVLLLVAGVVFYFMRAH